MSIKKTKAYLKKKLSLELLLLRRLKTLGIVLFLISGGFLYQAITFSLQDSNELSFLEEETEKTELCPHESFNFFAVSLLFSAIGTTCLYTSWKKTQAIRSKKE